jgi:hypothetical protein
MLQPFIQHESGRRRHESGVSHPSSFSADENLRLAHLTKVRTATRGVFDELMLQVFEKSGRDRSAIGKPLVSKVRVASTKVVCDGPVTSGPCT